jgi:hypothetical protein
MKKTDQLFCLHHRYLIERDYPGGTEASSVRGEIHKGQRLVYLGCTFNRYDGLDVFEFWDIDKGGTFRLEVDEHASADAKQYRPTIDEALAFQSVLKDEGVDIEPGSFTVGDGAADSDYSVLQPHLTYLKNFVEGVEGIKSWFVWLQESSALLNKHFCHMDLLRFKSKGLTQAKRALSECGIEYTPSPRYAYVEPDRHSWSQRL